jgi:hypothetical protein
MQGIMRISLQSRAESGTRLYIPIPIGILNNWHSCGTLILYMIKNKFPFSEARKEHTQIT